MPRFAATATLLAVTLACGSGSPPPDPQAVQPGPPPESEAPVALNPDVPIAYPAALFDQHIEGEVVLRLYADSTGRLIPESTRVAESSNYPALDSAALAGSAKLRFAPAKRRGVAVGTMFLQPVEFHYPGAASGGSSPPPSPTVTVPAPRRATIDSTLLPPVAPRPTAPRVRPDTIRPPRDTTKARADTIRPPADTTRPPTDTTSAAPH